MLRNDCDQFLLDIAFLISCVVVLSCLVLSRLVLSFQFREMMKGEEEGNIVETRIQTQAS